MIKLGHFTPAFHEQARIGIRNQALVDASAMARLGVSYGCWWSAMADLPRARNEALELAIRSELDYLVMQDADVVAVVDSQHQASPIAQLLETARAHGSTVVGAVCRLRHSDALNLRELPAALVGAVTGIGAGMILIDVHQLVRLARAGGYTGPWFRNVYSDERESRLERGEDLYFCRLVRDLGGTVWADGRIATDHDGHLYSPAVTG